MSFACCSLRLKFPGHSEIFYNSDRTFNYVSDARQIEQSLSTPFDTQAREQGLLQRFVCRLCFDGLFTQPYSTGTRAAFLPGGHRTGAPGKHVISGKAKYRVIDEKVRYFVAPSIESINNSPVRTRS
jgi:hypothetical protein